MPFRKLSPSMRKRVQKTLADASGHLHEVSGLSREGELDDSHSSAFRRAKDHGRALDALHGMLSSAAEESEQGEEAIGAAAHGSAQDDESLGAGAHHSDQEEESLGAQAGESEDKFDEEHPAD